MENTPAKSEEQPLVTSNSETATVAASDTDSTAANTSNSNNDQSAAATEDTIAAVTSSPNTTDPNDFPTSFQQLHEAVLAAVNSNSLPNSFFAAAAAAAVASQNVSIHPQSFDQTSLDQTQMQVPAQPQASLQPQTQPQHTEKPAKRSTAIAELDEAKRESIRASNRERKKKWRLHNEERNKDNDLRCRVNKRANKVFGPEDSPQKQAWVQEEFEKRRQKRMDKERRKHIVNNVLSVPGTTPTIATGSTAESATSTAAATPHMDDNLAAQNLAQANQLASSFYLPQIDTEAAAKILGLSTDLHRQLLEQLNGNLMALSNGILQSTQAAAAAATENITPTMTTDQSTSSNDTTMPDLTAVSASAEEKPAEASQLPTPTENTAISSNTSTNDAMSVDEQTPAETAPETATDNSKEKSPEKEESNNNQNASSSMEEVKTEDEETDGNKEEKKSEYPMDAVLTLMQLNAGWRH